jgi:hypothetical protein
MTEQLGTPAMGYDLAALNSESPPRSKLRLHFSLLALFIFLALAGVVLVWFVQPNRVVATAVFRVAHARPTIFAESTSLDEHEYEVIKRTHLAAIGSYFVLESALRKPGIASLPIFATAKDPVEWLQEHIEAEYPQNGELLYIMLRGTESQGNDLVTIVNAVAEAYKDEVIYKTTQHQLGVRDLAANSAKKLKGEIESKMEELTAMRVESGEKATDSPDINLRQLELDVLIDQWRELYAHVERLDIDATAPPRIEQMQRAVVGPE